MRSASFIFLLFFLSSCVSSSLLFAILFHNKLSAQISNQRRAKVESKPEERIVSFQQGFHEETREVSPANLLIKIESFSLLREKGIKSYEPRAFEAGGYKWKVIIYPEGYEKEDPNSHVSVHLSIAETNMLPVGWEVNAIFNFFLYNHISNNYLCFRGPTRRFNAVNPKVEFSELISKKRLTDSSEGFVVNDSCVFGAEVLVIKTQRINECLSLNKDTDPYKREWKISHYSRYDWSSEEFVAGGYKWNVKLYPRGNGWGISDYVSIFLSCVDSKRFAPHQKLKAEIRMSIKSKPDNNNTIQQYSRNFNQWFGSSSQACGDAEFISNANMGSGGFIVDNSYFLEIEISVQAVVLDAPKIN